jgi:Protein of unknown function (DUF4244)
MPRVDQTLVDQTLVDQTLVDQTLVDQTLVDQTLVDQALVDQALVDRTPEDWALRDASEAAVPAGRRRLRQVASDAGMTTAEYAVGTVAACGFAGVLYKLLTSSTVVSLLTGIVKRALSTGV